MEPGELKNLLPDHADDGTATHILHACETTGLPLSYGLALCQKEGGFRMVWGHDHVPNTVKSPPGGYLRVTRVNYAEYKRQRKAGKGMQGCGHTQLTWFSYQDDADALGGCWRPYPNLVVGFRLLATLVHQHGLEHGAARYNGTGPAAEAYGRDFVVIQRTWHNQVI